MNRRGFFAVALPSVVSLVGCRGTQVGEVIRDGRQDLVGNTAAGAETYKPLIDDALGKLLARQSLSGAQPVSTAPLKKRICFVGLENASSEEIGDFKAQIIDIIDTKINQSRVFEPISMRYTEAGLRKLRMRPEELFLPENQRKFLGVMESQGAPFDYLLIAKITSGTTTESSASQKDYTLSLEMVDIATGRPDKEMATIRKGYYKTMRR